jgi:hypothetical protein
MDIIVYIARDSPYVLATIDAKALSLAADSCQFMISGAFALLRVCQM